MKASAAAKKTGNFLHFCLILVKKRRRVIAGNVKALFIFFGFIFFVLTPSTIFFQKPQK